jgi:hypothetical protein
MVNPSSHDNSMEIRVQNKPKKWIVTIQFSGFAEAMVLYNIQLSYLFTFQIQGPAHHPTRNIACINLHPQTGSLDWQSPQTACSKQTATP